MFLFLSLQDYLLSLSRQWKATSSPLFLSIADLFPFEMTVAMKTQMEKAIVSRNKAFERQPCTVCEIGFMAVFWSEGEVWKSFT